jgi:hypothetical protein
LEQRIGSPEVSKAPAGKATRSRSDYDAAGASTRNSTESRVFGTRRNASPARAGSRAPRFACEAKISLAKGKISLAKRFRFAPPPRQVFEIIGRKTREYVRFAVSNDIKMLRSILFRAFLHDVSVILMGVTFDFI